MTINLQLLLLASGTVMIIGTSEVPDECKDQNYCTIKPPDYPQEMFDKMFEGTKLGLLPKLVITKEMEAGIDVANRQGPGEYSDCRATVSYEPLYRVKRKDSGDWRVVINSEQNNYVQRVRLEKCLTAGDKCFTPFPDALGYETFCKQEYNDWEIAVADGKGGTETIAAALPVCCSCFYRSIDITSRFGKPKN